MGLKVMFKYMKLVKDLDDGVSLYFDKCAELGLLPPQVKELEANSSG